mmetsp:Transcript_34653/g.55899  ORF Transcript_34653/g.55899 Transcript_34653/m.55899 type:complete len:132 (-) Transcript_34653:866-1261(-)
MLRKTTRPPVFKAVSHGCVSIVRAMIEAKAVVTNLMAALHIPSNATMDKSLLPEIEERAVAMTTLLLAHGADPDAFALRRHRGLSGVESALVTVNTSNCSVGFQIRMSRLASDRTQGRRQPPRQKKPLQRL